MDVDPNYVKQAKYPSGNEGRRHPNLKHDGYFQGSVTPGPPMDPKLLAQLLKQIQT